MEVSNRVTPAILSAASALLVGYCPDLSPKNLLAAIRSYAPEGNQNSAPSKLLSRKDAADLLGVSLPTVNRLLNRGAIRRIRITSGCVKVDAESVRALLAHGITSEVCP